MTPPICPNCGLDLATLEPVQVGRFGYNVHDGFSVDGKRLGVVQQLHEVLGTVMLDRGHIVSDIALMERLGREWKDPGNTAHVLLTDIKKAFAVLDIPVPVERVHGRGLRWRV